MFGKKPEKKSPILIDIEQGEPWSIADSQALDYYLESESGQKILRILWRYVLHLSFSENPLPERADGKRQGAVETITLLTSHRNQAPELPVDEVNVPLWSETIRDD